MYDFVRTNLIYLENVRQFVEEAYKQTKQK
jgi:hypothetical protein